MTPSSPEPRPLLVLSTCPSVEVARTVAERLLADRLAACITMLPAARSWYRWQGVVETAEEWPVLIKTTEDRYPALETVLAEIHPYDVPEILAFEAVQGLDTYVAWIRAETSPVPASGTLAD